VAGIVAETSIDANASAIQRGLVGLAGRLGRLAVRLLDCATGKELRLNGATRKPVNTMAERGGFEPPVEL